VHESGISEEMFNRISEQIYGQQAATDAARSSMKPLDDNVPNLANFDEALTWARLHEVDNESAHLWDTARTLPEVDLRLAPESLPIVTELLVMKDVPVARTAHIALQCNGARIETDFGWQSPATYFRVTYPDGSSRTVAFGPEG
jgi:hypothetical protein